MSAACCLVILSVLHDSSVCGQVLSSHGKQIQRRPVSCETQELLLIVGQRWGAEFGGVSAGPVAWLPLSSAVTASAGDSCSLL